MLHSKSLEGCKSFFASKKVKGLAKSATCMKKWQDKSSHPILKCIKNGEKIMLFVITKNPVTWFISQKNYLAFFLHSNDTKSTYFPHPPTILINLVCWTVNSWLPNAFCRFCLCEVLLNSIFHWLLYS